MGSIHKYGKDGWRVQFKHTKLKPMSMTFETFEEAQEFHDEINIACKEEIKRLKIIEKSKIEAKEETIL